MRRLALSLALFAVACRTAPAVGSAGAPSAMGAVQEFLAAAHGGDVRAMSALFGTSAGPVAARDDANAVEKRMRALQCYLTHDAARVVDERPSLSGPTRELTVELTQRTMTRRTTFVAVPGPHERWFVQSFDITKLTGLCNP